MDLDRVLARLARSTVIEDGNLDDVLRAITETAAAALDVERVNIWLLDRERTRMTCVEAYERSRAAHSTGDELLAAAAPSYFEAIQTLRAVVAFDARQDPRTRELADTYLARHDIVTLLDAPVYRAGKVAGVVCHEHVATPRQWTLAQQAFAASIGDLVSLAIEADRRLRAERSLREGEELFRAVGDRLADAMFLLDAQDPATLPVRYANEAACRLYGYAPEELVGLPASAIGVVDQAALDALERILVGETILFDMTNRRRDASTVTVEVYARAIDCAGRPTIVALARDVSRRVQAERAHLEFQAKVLGAQRRESLGILAGGMAHEFSNLIMGILGRASLVLAELPGSDTRREHVGYIETTARRAADLCHQLQAYAGRGRFEPTSVQLASLVEGTVRLLRAAMSHQVTLRAEVASELPPIDGDAIQLRQALVALVTNAVEALGDRPGTVMVRTSVCRFTAAELAQVAEWPAPEGDYACIEVTDSGAGMSEGMRRRIFEPLFTTKVAGRGLGLAAVQGIMRAHRGTVSVSSLLGHGTTVRLLVPILTRAVYAASAEVAGAGIGTGTRRLTILVVDDEPLVCEVATVALETAGFTVLTARDGRETCELVRARQDIGVVVLDVELPDLPGDQILRELRLQRPTLPVIVSTGHHESSLAPERFGADLVGFLHKPWQLSELLAMVARALGPEAPADSMPGR